MSHLTNWWGTLSENWKSALQEHLFFTSYVDKKSEIVDANLLDQIINLRDLNCSYSYIEDLSPLRDINKLNKFDCADTYIKDLEPIRYLKYLQKLDIMNCKNATNINCLENLDKLTMLNISGSSIQDIDAISDKVYITKIAMSSTNVLSLKALNNLSKIRELTLNNTQVDDLSYIFNNKNLVYLGCRNTNIDIRQVEEYKVINPRCIVSYNAK